MSGEDRGLLLLLYIVGYLGTIVTVGVHTELTKDLCERMVAESNKPALQASV